MSENFRLSESIWNATKTLGCLAVSITFTFVVATGAFAQEGVRTFGYFTNANIPGVPDASMFVVNPGSTGGFSPGGDLCANIYVFRSDQQLEECCSCKITPDGLRTFSVNTDLTNNPLTAIGPQSGAIKVVSSAVPAGDSCTISNGATSFPVAATTYQPSGLLGTWITHVHATPNGVSVSEANFFPGVLSAAELGKLQRQCNLIAEASLGPTGSGIGICTCGSE